ncbi:hypothetical protein SSX86_011802 [Deinandra increscens subsp. villosa]|uniref:Uncharacterized protein n=1 Tax=Deinandra increscens subsp. villosa TaxID=3103831 RepID=A0AAP0D2Y0_9ASTR
MSYNVARTRSQKKPSTASGGIRSLSLAIVVPVGLTVTSIFWFGENHNFKDLTRPFWIPPLWGLQLTSLSSAFLMGLSAWLVWAESGFHRTPMSIVMYLAQLGFGLAWNHIFFKTGPTNQIGLAASVGQLVTIFLCSQLFSRINPISGDLVKLCLLWTGFLMSVNLYYVI